MSYQKTLAALADPTRRALWERVRQRPCTVGELAKAARITQPAVSQHLRVLRSARLVTRRREGTRQWYSASARGLVELRQWVETMWEDVLSAYGEG